MSRSRTVLRFALVVGAVGLLAAGCSSDSGDGESAATTAADVTTTTVDTSDAFCEASETVNAAVTAGPDVDFATATEAEIGAAFVELLGGLQTDIEALAANAPADLSDQMTTITHSVDTAVESDDPSSLTTEEFEGATDALFETSFETCDWSDTSVTGVNYAFEDLPTELPAGPTGLTFTNEGNEGHELIVMQRNEGVTESFSELLALPEEEATAKVTVLGGVSPIEPGASDTAFFDLEAGEYLAICFLPVGGGEEGPPHFLEGMQQEFTVE